MCKNLSHLFRSGLLSFFLLSHTPSPAQCFMLHLDEAIVLSEGGILPPMTEVPCSAGPLKAMIKPPNVETLYDWYVSRNMKDADPSWGVLWPTAVSLASYLIDNPSIVKNKRVVELGSGLSLCGLTTAALGAESVIISDREPYALHCALATASLNGLNNVVSAAVIDWTDETNGVVKCADVVIASDVLYDKETIQAFGMACERILSSNGVVIVTDPKVERVPKAREMLRESLRDDVHMEITDLDLVDDSFSCETPDAKDHSNRMKEPTVLIKCRL